MTMTGSTPQDIEQLLNQAMGLFDDKRFGDAEALLDRAMAQVPDNPEVLKSLAQQFARLGRNRKAITALETVRQLAPGDIDAEAMLRYLYTSTVKAWHFPMMNDHARNQAFDRAIRGAVGPDTHVLEIGTGSGLLALMAARAGARHVTTCEAVDLIAETADEIIAANGYGDRVTVVAKPSRDLEVGTDMPGKADLLIAEILGTGILDEHVVEAFGHARADLLKPGAPVIPRAIGIMSRLVGGPSLVESFSVGTVQGFDLSPFNRFIPNTAVLREETSSFESFSEDMEVFRIALDGDPPEPETRHLKIAVTRSGISVGVLQWVRLYLDDKIVCENAPAEILKPSAWKHVLFTFGRPVEVSAGQTLAVVAAHNLQSTIFTLDASAAAEED